MNILVLNAGSSSLKFGLYRLEGCMATGALRREACLAEGGVERIGTPDAGLRLTYGAGDRSRTETHLLPAETPAQAAEQLLRRLIALRAEEKVEELSIEAIGCRVVHGGSKFVAPTLITPAVLNEIRALADLAPLHNPTDVAVIEAAQRSLPQSPIVAVFDTAFHSSLPAVAATYALPQDISARYGLRRYGFHGISHRYVSEKLNECLGPGIQDTRVIVCHLGNGASVCAVRDGRSVDTSMGLTPMEGLVMGTRSGDVDPGLILYLLKHGGRSVEEVEAMLNRQSGLLGLSGLSSDARDLEKAGEDGDERAEPALEVFAYRVSKYIGAYVAALEGVNGLAFTGGIGEHSATMRRRICRRLRFFGLHLEESANQSADGSGLKRISKEDSQVPIWVIPTDEARQIARETYTYLCANPIRLEQKG